MAETEDRTAHIMSLPGYPVSNTINMLDGARFKFDSNTVFRMPADLFNKAKLDPDKLGEYAKDFITQHYDNQVYRFVTLERYYSGDNDIHYWFANKAKNRADNRIASGIPAYITNIRVGYSFGNAVKFQYNAETDSKSEGEDLTDIIKKFNNKADEAYHEKVMKKKLSITGRSYELLYVRPNTTDAMVKALDPSNCFVVYDTTVEQNSLFAVYYYPVTFQSNTQWYITIYTASDIYYYEPQEDPKAELTFDHTEPHYFDGVPITEYINSDERMGDWERQLDNIDEYDKSLSEMANSQEDFSNAVLVLTGDVETAKDGKDKGVPDIDRHHLILWLKPKVQSNGVGTAPTVITPTAQYLEKSLPSADWQTYIDQLMNDIHKYTNTPNVNDENFASNASGVAMSYKLWGDDQERAIQESLYTKGLMRRYRLLANYWAKTGDIKNVDEVENIQPIFTPNLPKNDQEIVTNIQTLASTSDFSKETIRGMAESVTGVKPDEETKRADAERDSDPDRIDRNMFNDDSSQSDGNQPPQAASDAQQVDSNSNSQSSNSAAAGDQ